MEKILNWLKANKKTVAIVVVLLVVAGLAYYFRDKIMPGVSSASDGNAAKPEDKPVDQNLVTPGTPTRPVFAHQERIPGKLVKDVKTIMPNANEISLTITG